MPDKRQNRGAHPDDCELFHERQGPALRAAVAEYAWLLSRHYPAKATLKLVGDRHELRERQRTAVRRACCSDQQLVRRRQSERPLAGIEQLAIDGLNLLITVEAALAGAVVLLCRDGTCRDLASIHGTYRRVRQTTDAIVLVARHLRDADVRRARWLLDRPVSNSGKLRGLIEEYGLVDGLDVDVELVDDPDRVLLAQPDPVASADAWVLDGANSWVNLAREVIERHVPNAWCVDLSLADISVS